MSEEMKMSEAFNIPLHGSLDKLGIIDSCDLGVGWADAFSGEQARDCFVEAVNNHDRLVEENNEMLSLLKKIRSDLLLRGDRDNDDGVIVVDLSSSLWEQLRKFS